MAIRHINYYFKEASSNFFLNGLMSGASVITVTAALILLGLFFLIGVNFKEISQQLQSDCEIRVVIDDAASASEQRALYEKIKKMPYVKSASYESKEQALENFKSIFDLSEYENDPFEDMESDFLRNYVVITMKDLSHAEELVNDISKLPHVLKVINRKDTIQAIMTFSTILQNGSLISMLGLMFIAFFIISNTIKLSVHAREEEIHIMKYIGATDRFIRWPFIIEGVFVGLIGGAIASFLLYWGYMGAVSAVKRTLDIFNFASPNKIILPLALLLVGFGVVIGAYASMFSLRRHLRV